jgi:hypothetical protein
MPQPSARARRQVNEAVAALRQAEDITPEQVRGHELVRQLVSDLLTMQDPSSSELRDLAARVGAARLSSFRSPCPADLHPDSARRDKALPPEV